MQPEYYDMAAPDKATTVGTTAVLASSLLTGEAWADGVIYVELSNCTESANEPRLYFALASSQPAAAANMDSVLANQVRPLRLSAKALASLWVMGGEASQKIVIRQLKRAI